MISLLLEPAWLVAPGDGDESKTVLVTAPSVLLCAILVCNGGGMVEEISAAVPVLMIVQMTWDDVSPLVLLETVNLQ